jgi:hypothetical protein
LDNTFLKLVTNTDQTLNTSHTITTNFKKLTQIIKQFNNNMNPLKKTRTKLQKLRQKIAELEKQIAKP